MSDMETVKARYSYVHAVQYSDGWAIVYLPFEPENVGAQRVGFGPTEPEAWADARAAIEAKEVPTT